MLDFEIEIPEGNAIECLEAKVELWAGEIGLTCTLKTSLRKSVGSIHWHFKQGKTRGTLEVTLSPSSGRLWCSIQAGRTGDWLEGAIQSLNGTIGGSVCRLLLG